MAQEQKLQMLLRVSQWCFTTAVKATSELRYEQGREGTNDACEPPIDPQADVVHSCEHIPSTVDKVISNNPHGTLSAPRHSHKSISADPETYKREATGAGRQYQQPANPPERLIKLMTILALQMHNVSLSTGMSARQPDTHLASSAVLPLGCASTAASCIFTAVLGSSLWHRRRPVDELARVTVGVLPQPLLPTLHAQHPAHQNTAGSDTLCTVSYLQDSSS
jgi:hypothetical protein